MGPFDEINKYAGEAAGSSLGGPVMARTPTLQNRLDQAVADAEQRLAEVKEARNILSRNPDLERLLNIMQKGRF